MADAYQWIIEQLGWYWDLYGAGGWVHDDVRDDDGALIPFATAAAVVRYLALEVMVDD